jgi:hypothetical protein
MAVYDPRGGGNVHIDRVLTNISMGYPNEDLLGPVLSPSVRVAKQSDLYYVHGREGWVVEPGSDVRAPGTEANEIPGLKLSTNPYFAREYALQIPVTDEERENADAPLSPDRDGTELVTGKLLLARELRMKDMFTTAANYAAGNSTTLVGTQQFNDAANSNPISVFKTARDALHAKLFIRPNLAVIPYQVMSALEDHPDFIERIKYSQAAFLTEDLIARMLGIPRIVVPGVGYNSARMGQTEAINYLWGKDIILAYVPQRPGLKTPAFAYEFTWRYPGGQEQITERWYEQKRKSTVIRVSRRYDIKFIAVDATCKSTAGYLIKNAVA